MSTRSQGPPASIRALAALLVASLAGPVIAQTEFNARPFITVDVDNDPTQRTDVPTESEYVPGVVASENGLASFEALKAQAVAARTFAYYILDIRNPSVIGDGQNDQVFSNVPPSAIHLEAARATEGEILYVEDFQQRDILIASFYVAGAIPQGPFDPDNPSARPLPGTPSLGNTERFVTFPFEDGLSGGFNLGSPLGFQGTPTNPNFPNRGAKSQNGADFLSDNSISYVDILKYYYGADIQLRTATTAGTGVEFGRKVLTDFDNFGSGRRSDGIIEGHNGFFNRPPTFSGSNLAIADATAERDELLPQGGTDSQRIDIDFDESAGGEFLLRHVSAARFSEFGGQSNVAARVANLQLEAIGSIGFYLRTTTPGLRVSLAIDDPTTGDRGVQQPVIADGEWHEYKWFLENDSDFEAWIAAGNGAVDGELITIDSIQLFGSSDATVFLDTVFWDPSDVFTPSAIGDYNSDGVVDAADYTIWRDTLGSGIDLRADGTGDGAVTVEDYALWQRNLGRRADLPGLAVVPEPAAGAGFFAASLALLHRRPVNRRPGSTTPARSPARRATGGSRLGRQGS